MCSECPGRASPPPPESGDGLSRRTLFQRLAYLAGGLAAAAAAVPVLGFIFAPIAQPDAWTDAGPVDEFPEHQTRLVSLRNPVSRPWDGAAGKVGAYVRRLAGGNFQVFAINCTHLGCPVSWFPQSGLFLCPCHGGVYYADGSRASGPPPRGLYQLPHRIVRGRLQVRTGHFPTLEEPA